MTYYNLVKQFVTHMNDFENQEKSFFSFNFQTAFAHSWFAIPEDMDIQLRDLLGYFDSKRFFDNTILIIFGDHDNKLTSYGAIWR